MSRKRRWECLFATYVMTDTSVNLNTDEMTEIVNAYGENGWELMSSSIYKNTLLFCFKRKIRRKRDKPLNTGTYSITVKGTNEGEHPQ